MLEAMACGVTVIGSNVGEIPYVIGDAGIIFPENDAKALLELDTNLRKMDARDPSKYDFALFGLGVFEKF